MDRLTKKTGEGYTLDHENCPKRGQCYDSADCVDVLLERLAAYEDAEEEREKLHTETQELASHAIPSVDVVEVVRCKDCKHSEVWGIEKRIGCKATYSRVCLYFWKLKHVKDDDFCSCGAERGR